MQSVQHQLSLVKLDDCFIVTCPDRPVLPEDPPTYPAFCLPDAAERMPLLDAWAGRWPDAINSTADLLPALTRGDRPSSAPAPSNPRAPDRGAAPDGSAAPVDAPEDEQAEHSTRSVDDDPAEDDVKADVLDAEEEEIGLEWGGDALEREAEADTSDAGEFEDADAIEEEKAAYALQEEVGTIEADAPTHDVPPPGPTQLPPLVADAGLSGKPSWPAGAAAGPREAVSEWSSAGPPTEVALETPGAAGSGWVMSMPVHASVIAAVAVLWACVGRWRGRPPKR